MLLDEGFNHRQAEEVAQLSEEVLLLQLQDIKHHRLVGDQLHVLHIPFEELYVLYVIMLEDHLLLLIECRCIPQEGILQRFEGLLELQLGVPHPVNRNLIEGNVLHALEEHMEQVVDLTGVRTEEIMLQLDLVWEVLHRVFLIALATKYTNSVP